MQKYLEYDTQRLVISQIRWNRQLSAKSESIMALGNGYLGLRAVDEEIEDYNKEDFFVNGIFNRENINEVDELVNLANLISNQIIIDQEIFSLRQEDVYHKSIDLKTGILWREIKFSRQGKMFSLAFERFVSQVNQHFYGQKIILKQLSGRPSTIILRPEINGQSTNTGAQHLCEGQKRRLLPTAIQYLETTTTSQHLIIHNLFTELKVDNQVLPGGTDNYVLTMGRRKIGFKMTVNLKTKQTLTLTKLMSVNTTIDDEESLQSKKYVSDKAQRLFEQLQNTSYALEKEKSIKKWTEMIKKHGIEINGNQEAKYAQLANYFAFFHMNSFTPKNNSNLSIGAKGLTGEGYQGHTFWDTEIFILPNYLFIDPKIARNLLVYRYKGLVGARKKAQETNLIGAQYPWEAAWPIVGEVCPYWGQADVVSGKQVPIASREQEIHVPADIAYAVDQYFCLTKDDDFMNHMGYAMIFETATYWVNRVEQKLDNTYQITNVMGPNEYKGNVDNNAYTNALAKHNLQLALKYYQNLKNSISKKQVLQEILDTIPYLVPFSKMEKIINNLVQQEPNADQIIAENDQFLKLPISKIDDFKLLGDAGKSLFNTIKGQKLLGSQLVKQADVVLLNFLLPHLFTKEVATKNLLYYEKITTHDSSLSASTYALQALRLGQLKLANQLYNYAINIDLGSNMNSCDQGIHAGAMAAIWQISVFGYGGLTWEGDLINFKPILPRGWSSLKYQIWYQKTQILIKVYPHKITLKISNEGIIDVLVYGKKYKVSKEEIEVPYD